MKVHYDDEEDILYLARPGEEEECLEIAPGVSVELDSRGRILGFEIMNASLALRGVLTPLRRKLQQAA